MKMKMSTMARCVVALAVILPISASISSLQDSRSELEEALRPTVVAQTLARVADEWKAQAAAFAECSQHAQHFMGDCKASQQSFAKSCTTVVDAVVKGSDGDQNRARDYMQTVCGEKVLTAWHKDRCVDLKQAIDGSLKFNAYANRMNFNSVNLCSNFWSTFAESEMKRATAEAQVEAKRVEAERAVQKDLLIKANEKAKAVAEMKRQEEAHEKVVEAHRQAHEAEEAAAKARQESADRLARKRAEVEAMAAEAQQRVKKAAVEAAKAEEEHRQRQLEHEKAEEELRKIQVAHKQETAAAPAKPSSKASIDAPAKPIQAMAIAPKVAAPWKEGIIVTPLKNKIVVAVSNVTAVAGKAPLPAKNVAFLHQDPCAGCDTGLAQAYQSCAMKHGNPCAETNAAGIVGSGPGKKKDIGCCMKKEKHDRCLKCKGMDCAHGTCNVNKKYYSSYAKK